MSNTLLERSGVITASRVFTRALCGGGGIDYVFWWSESPTAITASGFCASSSTLASDMITESQFGQKINEYFSGQGGGLTALPISFSGATDTLDREVYRTLRRAVPLGSTISYRDLGSKCVATEVRFASLHPRRIGLAMKRNPIPVLVPCHRVVPALGGIGNYTPGVVLKKFLLDLEARYP